MTKKRPAPFPSREEILHFIEDSPKRVGKREIARAFKLDAEQKRTLKKVLREMEQDGSLERERGRRVRKPGALPPVTVIEIAGTDADGELVARPLTWDGDGEAPVIYVATPKHGPAPGRGERLLARLTALPDGAFEARTIRRIAAAPRQVLGVFDIVDGIGRIRPADRRERGDFAVESRDSFDARPGDLVRAEPLRGRRLGLRPAKVVERLARGRDAAAPAMIAIADHDLPTRFTPDAEAAAAKAGPAPAKGRDDLRKLPLVTIDGADARDFDDAVWAAPDDDKKNPGGWRLVVAIADVAWYARPGGALDKCAYERGNSVYFPDRVVPMLPEALSNGWCSLVAGEDRPCIAARMRIDSGGRLLSHEFRRAIMRSRARLTYEQAQAARDGSPDKTTKPLLDDVIAPLYGAYGALAKNRAKRGALELDLPERRVELAPDGTVQAIGVRRRLPSHMLIEEFMIAANVAAAEALEKKRLPCLYRVHDAPPKEKLDALRDVLEGTGIRFSRGGVVTPGRFNQVLKKAAGTPHAAIINEMVLRTQAQAEYAPGNIGHFGLALRRYCHFTSPIRRYSDLLVHRALIAGFKLGADGLGKDAGDFEKIGQHLSDTERRAAAAERDATDRYTAAYLAARVGAVFEGRVNGVTRFGLFVTLDETGADGLVPVRTLPDDHYVFDDAHHALRGRRTKRTYRMGDRVEVRLTEANPVSGGMVFALMDSGATAPRRGQDKGPRGKPKRRTGKGQKHRNR